jgi:pyruvate dehydrogenase E1 component
MANGEKALAAGARPADDAQVPADTRRLLGELERKVLWLSAWTIHNANLLRDNPDGLKVGGHQASCASLTTLMTALYFHVLRPEDRVAVKPHASPVFHAIQYLRGQQDVQALKDFRGFGGAQSYPSRTKDRDDVDFSTGSVGLGVAMTAFASLVQDYVALKDMMGDRPRGRMVALVGDAELDEGNVYECLLEGWKHDVRNCWWIIDYNRQSLDSVVSDRLFGQIDQLFRTMGWDVVTLKYGRRLQAAFAHRGGDALRQWIDDCPNSLYSALVFKGGAAWRDHLLADIGEVPGIRELLARYDDAQLHDLMTNLAGHDMDVVLETFRQLDADDRPKCIVAYTIKGQGLPFAGHKDNHAGIMNADQMADFQARNAVPAGHEWDRFAGLDAGADALRAFLDAVPFAQRGRRRFDAPRVPVPDRLPRPEGQRMSTQEGFGKILGEIARANPDDAGGQLAQRIVTTSPDVTVSTNLAGWVNRRGIWSRHRRADTFKEEKVVSAHQWGMSPEGQHLELGIAENNLFILLAAMGLSHAVFGARLLPVATLYDPFILRGLDALNYACYQDARFMLVATPSGISLAPEGGAHQSVGTPLIGMSQDGLAAFEPAFVDELEVILRWGFDYLQRDGSGAPDSDWLRDVEGGSVYLRLTTRAIEQPERTLSAEQEREIIQGGTWRHPPADGGELAIVYTGAAAPQAEAAFEAIREEVPGAGLLAVTSADRLNAGWTAAEKARQTGGAHQPSWVERLLSPLARDAALVTVLDGHPATLAWLGSVRGHRVQALGVEHFGQSGTLSDLYASYRIDADAILDACATALVERRRGTPR